MQRRSSQSFPYRVGREHGCVRDGCIAQIDRQQIEIGARILREPKWPVCSVHEALRSYGAEQMREMVLRGTPDPGEVPVDTPLLFRRQTPMCLLEYVTSGSGDDESHARAGPGDAPHVRGSEIAGDVEG